MGVKFGDIGSSPTAVINMNNKLKKRVLDTAFAMSKFANCKSKHISFIVDKNKILSVGWNDGWKTHPLAKKHGYRFSSIHSELAAIIRIGIDNCHGLTLINVRVNSLGEIRISKPCSICQSWLSTLGLKQIYYTNNEGRFEAL